MAITMPMPRSENRVAAEFTDAYYKVSGVEMLDNGKFRIKLVAYADEGARRYTPTTGTMPTPMMPHDGSKIIWERSFEADTLPETAGTNAADSLKKSAYTYIKTLPEFKDSEDC